MVTIPRTFNGTGANANGVSGNKNRVLTLDNTALTMQSGFLVYASGLALSLTTDYTVVHAATETKITFLNRLWDDMTIVVNYYQPNAAVSSDFLNGPINDFGITVVRTPVTVTTDFSGNKDYSDGSDENIVVVVAPFKENHNLDKAGLTKAFDAIVFLLPDATLNKYDKLTFDSKVYRVDEVSERNFDGTASFVYAGLFYMKDE